MYGETPENIKDEAVILSLSPHVRGNPQVLVVEPDLAESIPACTGKPEAGALLDELRKVYPRMYGETAALVRQDLAEASLSPHVRGNLYRWLAHLGRQESIPACTGKPRHRRVCVPGRRVYPRMYGETHFGRLSPALMMSLSPHVRGNLVQRPHEYPQRQSIPACTGKPPFVRGKPKPVEVYPRMYGETSGSK